MRKRIAATPGEEARTRTRKETNNNSNKTTRRSMKATAHLAHAVQGEHTTTATTTAATTATKERQQSSPYLGIVATQTTCHVVEVPRWKKRGFILNIRSTETHRHPNQQQLQHQSFRGRSPSSILIRTTSDMRRCCKALWMMTRQPSRSRKRRDAKQTD